MDKIKVYKCWMCVVCLTQKLKLAPETVWVLFTVHTGITFSIQALSDLVLGAFALIRLEVPVEAVQVFVGRIPVTRTASVIVSRCFVTTF
jgi:hypothetical protein